MIFPGLFFALFLCCKIINFNKDKGDITLCPVLKTVNENQAAAFAASFIVVDKIT